jgi:hypothetical protein
LHRKRGPDGYSRRVGPTRAGHLDGLGIAKRRTNKLDQRPIMKMIFRIALICLPLHCLAQSFSIDWFSIDGGGGTSSGGPYQVSGAIGQPDPGTLKGGNYSLAGGFFVLLSVVQTPGIPELKISLSPTNTAVISWPSPSTGFTLQQNTNDIAAGTWTDVATNQDNGVFKYIIVNPQAGNRFYRLFKP